MVPISELETVEEVLDRLLQIFTALGCFIHSAAQERPV